MACRSIRTSVRRRVSPVGGRAPQPGAARRSRRWHRCLHAGATRSVGLAGEVAPAWWQDSSTIERLAVLHHELPDAADVAQARPDAKPAHLEAVLGLEEPAPVGLHAGRPPDLLGAVIGQRPAGRGCDHRPQRAALAGRIVEDDTLRMSARQAAHEVQDGAWPPARQGPLRPPESAAASQRPAAELGSNTLAIREIRTRSVVRPPLSIVLDWTLFAARPIDQRQSREPTTFSCLP